MPKSLSSLGEFGLIKQIQSRLPGLPSHRWPVGIGDDTSVLFLNDHHYQLFTHDLLLEKVHFVAGSPGSFQDIGWKALAVNLSDIAAMGGVPQEAVVGLGIPSSAKTSEINAFYDGMTACGKKYHCPIVGGDTNRSRGGWVFSVAVTGFCSRLPLLRKGAEPGDSLWVTGTLGGAALGLTAIQKKDSTRLTGPYRKSHCRPQPRLLWGQRLLSLGWLSAMIDISDGLGGDLGHLAEASGVGFEVEISDLPRPKDFAKAIKQLKVSEEEILLGGGEDYELLFTLKGGKENSFQKWARDQKNRSDQDR